MALKLSSKGLDSPGSEFASHLQDKAVLPVTGTVSVSKKVGGAPLAETLTQEQVSKGVMLNKAEVFSINVSGGQTINLGNYNSAKIGVSITLPTTKDELDEAYNFATAWVSEKLAKAMKEIESGGQHQE